MKQSSPPPAPDAYPHPYSGKTLVVKVGGKELMSPHFPGFVEYVQELARSGVKFIIICGSGEQNTQHLKSHLTQSGEEWREPERVGGRRVTDVQQMQHGVLPAQEEIRGMLQRRIPEATILAPEHIHCRRLPDLGFVGDPKQIEGLDSGNIVIALSVGSDGKHDLNVNADDTTRVVIQQERNRVNEALFATEAGGVLHEGKIARLLWAEDIADDGTHPRIDVTGGGGGMQKKLRGVKEMLRWIPKVVFTNIQGVHNEIEQALGSGTMIVARKSVQCALLRDGYETGIFDSWYAHHVQSGEFRSRTREELDALKKYVYVIKVSNSVLGAFALIPRGEWMELATVCSEYNGTGVGDVIVQEAQKRILESGNTKMYAMASSPGSAKLFMRHDFENLGDVSVLQKGDAAFYHSLACVSNYDTKTRGRDPSFCTWHATARDA